MLYLGHSRLFTLYAPTQDANELSAGPDSPQARGLRQEALAGEVDASRVALWGTSFAGGHVLVKGAERADDWRIRAIVSQARAPPAARPPRHAGMRGHGGP